MDSDQAAWPQASLLALLARRPAALQAVLLASVPWEQPRVTGHGRSHLALRQQWPALLGIGFNSLLINRYRTGDDTTCWHADDAPQLDPAVPIDSLRLGAIRTLRSRPILQRAVVLAEPGISPLARELAG